MVLYALRLQHIKKSGIFWVVVQRWNEYAYFIVDQ